VLRPCVGNQSQRRQGLEQQGQRASRAQALRGAFACFDHALEIDPNDAVAWYNKGRPLDNLKRYEEAIACDDRALAIDANYAHAWATREGCYLNSNATRRRLRVSTARWQSIPITPMLGTLG